jgi:hypothetical protein
VVITIQYVIAEEDIIEFLVAMDERRTHSPPRRRQ